MSKKIFVLSLLVVLHSCNVLSAMSEVTIVSTNDIEKKEAYRNFYYPEVQAAQDCSYGCAIAYMYFTHQLPKKKIADVVPFKDAYKYWTWAGNLPEAGRVIPEVKEFTKQVMTRAFALRSAILNNQLIDKELSDAVDEINEKIKSDTQRLKKWQQLAVIIESFKKTPIESCHGYLGHDV